MAATDGPMMAKVICVFNEKGGSGKTTTACQIAGTLGARGFKVLLADLDPSGTASDWLTVNGGDNFKAQLWPGHRYKEKVIYQIKELSEKYHVIVADCAPSVEQSTTWGVLLVADLALIPSRLSAPDMAKLPAAKKLARRALEESNRTYPVRVVANSARMHMSDDKAFYQLLAADKEFPVLNCWLSDRKAYSRSMMIGSTVHAVSKGEDAASEVDELTDQVQQLIGLTSIRIRSKN